MFAKDKMEVNKARSDRLSREVEEFLANGGKVETMRDCTPEESYSRSRKPRVIKCKDGKERLTRDWKKMF